MAGTTAYTSVAARRSFMPSHQTVPGTSSPASSPSSQPAQSAAPTVKVAWPQPVRDYVNRSFSAEAGIPGISRKELETKLKDFLSKAAEDKQLDKIDWTALPTPQQMIQQERAHEKYIEDNAWISIEKPDPVARKRKFGGDMQDAPRPPWETNHANGFGDRITYANDNQKSKMEKRAKKQQEALGKGTSKFDAMVQKRRQRFGSQLEDLPPWRAQKASSPVPDIKTGPVIGTCQKLEKQYFRLNGAPKAEEVRPLEVLKLTFDHIKKKWTQDGNYVYTCDQFKSMRQDLTVQHIKNEFTVKVYELHARIALEMGDLGEYNQCQTQLRALYSLKLGGHPAEFLAYRILYFVHTCNRTALNDILSEVTPELKQDEAVQHALAVRSAQACGNYHKLLSKLYQSVPNMGAYLMDMFVPRERYAALAVICKSYKPNVNIKMIAEELGFETYEAAADFLIKAGCEQAGVLTPPADAALEGDLSLWKLETSKAAPIFEDARKGAFRTVDIKGQI